jgi:hypothetical protein
MSNGEIMGYGLTLVAAVNSSSIRPFFLDLRSLALPDCIISDDLTIVEPAFSLELL